jgi:CRP-like cAMP-binding protein
MVLNYVSTLAGELVRRVRTIENKESKDKISSIMQYLAKIAGNEQKHGKFKIELKLTHQDIAGLAGVTRETASTQLKKLEQGKVIETRNGYLVVDTSRLNQDTNFN